MLRVKTKDDNIKYLGILYNEDLISKNIYILEYILNIFNIEVKIYLNIALPETNNLDDEACIKYSFFVDKDCVDIISIKSMIDHALIEVIDDSLLWTEKEVSQKELMTAGYKNISIDYSFKTKFKNIASNFQDKLFYEELLEKYNLIRSIKNKKIIKTIMLLREEIKSDINQNNKSLFLDFIEKNNNQLNNEDLSDTLLLLLKK